MTQETTSFEKLMRDFGGSILEQNMADHIKLILTAPRTRIVKRVFPREDYKTALTSERNELAKRFVMEQRGIV